MSSNGTVSRSHPPRNLPAEQGKITSTDHSQEGCPEDIARDRVKEVAEAPRLGTKSPNACRGEVKGSPLRSSAFGYARIAAHASAQTVRDMRNDLAAYAEREGYTLTEVFMEREDSGSSEFAALIDAINHSEPPIVVVPSMCHFAHLPGLQIAMKDLIERETGARVLVIAPACACDQQGPG